MDIEKELNVYGTGTHDFNNFKIIRRKNGQDEELNVVFSNQRQSPVTVLAG